MAEKDFINWHLLALFFLPFCLCQEEYMEVSRRSYKPVAKVLQSHHQTGHKSSRSREILNQRRQLIEWTVDNSTSTDQKVLRSEVDDVELTTSDRVQVLWINLLKMSLKLIRLIFFLLWLLVIHLWDYFYWNCLLVCILLSCFIGSFNELVEPAVWLGDTGFNTESSLLLCWNCDPLQSYTVM